MMDRTDHADEVEDRLKEYELQRIRKAKNQVSLLYSGACYYCSSTLPSPKIFCGSECRDDYEKEQRLLRIAGRT